MITKAVFLWFVMSMLVFLFCTQPQNPFLNPNNANIQADSSLRALTDTIKPQTEYSCSVNVFLPNLVDSFFVKSFDSTVLKGSVKNVSPIVFTFLANDNGPYRVCIVIVKTNGAKDSLVKTGQVIAPLSLAPVMVAVAASIHLFLGDSAVVKFALSDPDSDLAEYSTQLSLDQDTSKSHPQNHSYSVLSHVKKDTVVRILKDSLLFPGLSAPLICYAQAIDRKSTSSAVATCTLFVADTTPPFVKRVRPLKDSAFVLPDTVIAVVKDNWGIDSVKLNGAKMTLQNDTAVYIVPALAPGTTTIDTIAAWDKAGNLTMRIFTRIYSGPKVYPPVVKNIGHVVFTGNRFDTLFLDTCVIIQDPLISTSADTIAYEQSLIWFITDSLGNTINYNATSRKVVVPAPTDSLWTGIVKLTFKAIAPSGPSSVPKTAVFIVQDQPGTPEITLRNQSKQVGVAFDTLLLDTCATDADDSAKTLNWTIKRGKYFVPDSIIQCPPCITPPCLLCLKPTFRRRVAIIPDTTQIKTPSTWTGSDTLYFTVKDPGGLSKTKRIVFSKWSIIIRLPIIATLPKK